MKITIGLFDAGILISLIFIMISIIKIETQSKAQIYYQEAIHLQNCKLLLYQEYQSGVFMVYNDSTNVFKAEPSRFK